VVGADGLELKAQVRAASAEELAGLLRAFVADPASESPVG
jgi:hypothetical protein